MRRRFTIPLVVLLLCGCTASRIPLFQPTARPVNRVASANELITELNNQVVTLRADGVLDQSDINRTIGPVLDQAALTADAADAAIKAGNVMEGQQKLDVLAATLRAIRTQLAALEGVKR
jgi:hypothetical protein